MKPTIYTVKVEGHVDVAASSPDEALELVKAMSVEEAQLDYDVVDELANTGEHDE